LVLSNSLGTNLSMWLPQLPALSEHFRVVRYDTRGHGRSDVTQGPYTIAQLGKDVLSLMDELTIPRAHFCGLSMGGMTGIWLESVLERWFTADFLAHAPAQVERVRKMLQETSAEGYIANCAAVRDMDQRADVALIVAPTLVIGGRHDKATPPEHGELISRAIKGSRYVELNAAHLSNWEVAQAFTQTVLDFLLSK